jgi:hypothetical protein
LRPPTGAELDAALDAAERMRIRDVDPHHLARCLLYLWERGQAHEELLRHVDRYLRFGMDDRELAKLRRLVDRLREQQGDGGQPTRALPI